ncbi:NAD-dependent malic enzyme 62 kDa isoform, mitochondrial-like isoform X2 [Camellia sinensis]|uniref:NAD-dependent malic enzyme 62 kDa isoform, mitochondrial-like isoform X2 n=1 Tax=Camellia sinensis TaxID=4442 RepID=UPI001036E47C|nr:NAD-dependent malic enzyme 62 kDa isoform, mitochondrial-like isoform X2 [Camellia sinensis]
MSSCRALSTTMAECMLFLSLNALLLMLSIMLEKILFLQAGALSKMLTLGMEVGHVNQANQANNMYLFPGIKMGTLLSGAHLISDGMSQAASECIQDITAEVGAAIVRAVVAEELAEGRCDVGPRELRRRRWNMSNATCGFQFTALLFMRNKVPIISVCARRIFFYKHRPNVLQPFKYS